MMSTKFSILLAFICILQPHLFVNGRDTDWEVLNFAISDPGRSNPEVLKNAILNILGDFVGGAAPPPPAPSTLAPVPTTTMAPARTTAAPPCNCPACTAPPATTSRPGPPCWIELLGAHPNANQKVRIPCNFPGLPSLPSLPSVPSVPCLPSLPSLPSLPQIPIEPLSRHHHHHHPSHPKPCNCGPNKLAEFNVNVPCPKPTVKPKPIREIVVKVPCPTTKKPDCDCQCCPCNPCTPKPTKPPKPSKTTSKRPPKPSKSCSEESSESHEVIHRSYEQYYPRGKYSVVKESSSASCDDD